MEKPLISVIIPVYKVEEFLDQCLESVVNQTYSNLEILLVDDGSPDHCPAMCDRWAEKDSRIRVIHKENGGLSDARNTATLQAKGEYIAFVDSDDVLHPRYIEILYQLIDQTGAEISVCDLTRFVDEIPDKAVNFDFTPEKYDSSSVLEIMLYQKVFDTTAPAKMFSTEIARKCLYPKGRLYEDLFTTYKMFAASKHIAYCPCGLYYYRNNPESIMNQKFTTRMFDEIDAVDEITAFVEQNFPQVLPAALSRKFSSYSQVLRWTRNAPDSEEILEKKKMMWKFLTDYRWKMMTDGKARCKNRLGAVLTLLGMNTYINF